jgi:pimeloyl-ACP methyl ester carboxylesterase
MATADSAGTEIHYEVTGDGTPVVLLHGFPDSGRLWRHQVPALTGAGYRVIVPDMRGYGRSERPVEVAAYDIAQLVGDVKAVLADAGVPRAHVVGHDWGAATAWVLASLAPDTVDRLVALSIGHPGTFRGRPGQLDLDQLEKAWFMLLFQFPHVAEEWLSANQWTNFRILFRHPDEDSVIAELEASSSLTPGLNYFRAIVNPESFLGPPPALPAVEAPTLGVWSSGDFALTEAQMTRSAEHVAGSWHYARLEGPGHWMQLEAPDRVNALLLDFLAQE